MERLSIGEVARRAGVAPSTLRYYEHVGLLPPPARINTRRQYSLDVLPRLQLIKIAQQAGFTIAEIAVLVAGIDADQPLSERWHDLAQHKLGELDALIARLEGMKRLLTLGMQCGCVTLEDCVLYSG